MRHYGWIIKHHEENRCYVNIHGELSVFDTYDAACRARSKWHAKAKILRAYVSFTIPKKRKKERANA